MSSGIASVPETDTMGGVAVAALALGETVSIGLSIVQFLTCSLAMFVHLAQCAPPLPHATLWACGCDNLGAERLHLLQRATGNGNPAELQSQLGSGLCSISTRSTNLLFGSSFSSIFRSPPSHRWRGLLPSYIRLAACQDADKNESQ
jgi:hypothetical protein